MCLYSSRCLWERHAICLLNEEPPTATVWWLKGSRVLLPICPLPLCNTSVLWDLQKWDVSDLRCQDCQRNCWWDTARVTAVAVHLKATSVLLTGPLQETQISFLHFSFDAKTANFPTAFCSSPNLCQFCLSCISSSLGWHKCLCDRSEQPPELG